MSWQAHDEGYATSASLCYTITPGVVQHPLCVYNWVHVAAHSCGDPHCVARCIALFSPAVFKDGSTALTAFSIVCELLCSAWPFRLWAVALRLDSVTATQEQRGACWTCRFVPAAFCCMGAAEYLFPRFRVCGVGVILYSQLGFLMHSCHKVLRVTVVCSAIESMHECNARYACLVIFQESTHYAAVVQFLK